jgi:hypothetical protein
MNRTIYFPAISVGVLFDYFEKNVRIFDKSFRFYNSDENPFFVFKNMLMSSGHLYKKKTLAKDINIQLDKMRLFGDSGGYQIATNQMKLTDDIRKDIFNWLENNTNIAANIDIPPFVSSQKNQTGFFLDCLDISKKNMKFFDKNQSGSTKYLNILHGRTSEQFKTWYDGVSDIEFPGGWAIGSVSYNSFITLMGIFFLIENKEIEKYSSKNAIIHIFGLSSLVSMIFLIHIQHLLNQDGYNIKITYDSASPNHLAAYGKYVQNFSQGGFRLLRFSPVEKDRDLISNVKLACNCPVCKHLTWGTFYSYMQERNNKLSFKSMFYALLTMHNIYKYIETKNQIENLIFSNCPNIYEGFFSTNVTKALKIIDDIYNTKSGQKIHKLHSYKNFFRSFSVEKNVQSVAGFLNDSAD